MGSAGADGLDELDRIVAGNLDRWVQKTGADPAKVAEKAIEISSWKGYGRKQTTRERAAYLEYWLGQKLKPTEDHKDDPRQQSVNQMIEQIEKLKGVK